MKRIYTDEINFLKKGTVLHYINYDSEEIFFDAIVEFDRIENTTGGKVAVCNLLYLKETQLDWGSNYVNFYPGLEDNEEVYYMGPKEDYPEYFV
jgi:hypothetical protein